MLVLPATPEVIASVIAQAEVAPDRRPDRRRDGRPAVPVPAGRGARKLVAMALVCYAEDAAAGARAIAPFRVIAPPLVDLVHPSTYPELFPPEPDDCTGRVDSHPVSERR